MDQRDQLINQLSQYVSVQTASQGNNEVNVYIGSGQALVTGGTAQTLTTIPDAYDPSQLDIGVTSGGSSGTTADITSEISGGDARWPAERPQPGARSGHERPRARSPSGSPRSSTSSSSPVWTLTGAQGQAMFAVGGVEVLADSNNAGNASLTVTRGSLSALTADDYELKYTGGTTPGSSPTRPRVSRSP